MAKYINPLTGEETSNTSDIWGDQGNEFWGPNDGYYFNNLFRWRFGKNDFEHAIEYILKHGRPTDNQDLINYLNNQVGHGTIDNGNIGMILDDVDTYLKHNNISMDDLTKFYEKGGDYYNPDPSILNPGLASKKEAYDEYYNDLYSLKPGTLGRTMLDNFTLAEQNAAISNMELAEAQYQSSAMQQAETVKAITDSVKAERMARLRAGMSESQIANQDMQTMLNNMNTLNQNMDILNQNRYAAQQQYNLAQDTAYQQYIQSVTGLGGTSAAFAAASAGNPDYIARQYAKNVNKLYSPTHYGTVTKYNQ